MNQYFIRAKAWQLFLLFIVPLLLQPVLFMSGLTSLSVFGLITAFSGFVVVGWIWSIGVTANQRLPANLKKSTIVLSWGLLFALTYMLVLGIVFIPGRLPAYVLPVHLASMFFMFYALWFAARQFVTLERQQSAKFADFSGPFFLMWFYPIGVWFLQPQVNNLLSDRKVVT